MSRSIGSCWSAAHHSAPSTFFWARPQNACLAHTLAILLISHSIRPIFCPTTTPVFMTALVSLPVYTIIATTDPAASTVFAHSTFSTVRGTDSWSVGPGEVDARVRTPWNAWMSFDGGSASQSAQPSYGHDDKGARRGTDHTKTPRPHRPSPRPYSAS